MELSISGLHNPGSACFEIFVPGVGTVVFHRKEGRFPAVKVTVNTGGIPAAKYRKHLRADGATIDKHEVLTASGDSILFSDPEM